MKYCNRHKNNLCKAVVNPQKLSAFSYNKAAKDKLSSWCRSCHHFSSEVSNEKRRLVKPKVPRKQKALVPIEERFWNKVEMIPFHPCWEWVGSKDKIWGYGMIGGGLRTSKNQAAHRYSWELHNNAKIPEGLIICHNCDNPGCVNPAHLFLGTHTDNMRDMVNKGREADNRGDKNPNCKISFEIAEKIRNEYYVGLIPRKDLAIKYGLHRSYIWLITQQKAWAP